jgi:hypothetical protein
MLEVQEKITQGKFDIDVGEEASQVMLTEVKYQIEGRLVPAVLSENKNVGGEVIAKIQKYVGTGICQKRISLHFNGT